MGTPLTPLQTHLCLSESFYCTVHSVLPFSCSSFIVIMTYLCSVSNININFIAYFTKEEEGTTQHTYIFCFLSLAFTKITSFFIAYKFVIMKTFNSRVQLMFTVHIRIISNNYPANWCSCKGFSLANPQLKMHAWLLDK